MADRKATNKYYPPDFDAQKHGSINRYHGQHPLRERAKDIDKGILIVRFELPFNIWCGGPCGTMLGRGVRFNSKKKKVGMYYSTPILEFECKCPRCDNLFAIQTDPKNTEYVVTRGAMRKTETWDAKDNDSIQLTPMDVKARLESDAIFRLEHGMQDLEKVRTRAPGLVELAQVQSSAWKDPYSVNSALRSTFRQEKRILQKEMVDSEILGEKLSLDIPIAPETNEDREAASKISWNRVDSARDIERRRKLAIKTSSIFRTSTGATGTLTSTCGVGNGKQSRVSAAASSNRLRLLELKRRTGIQPQRFRIIGHDAGGSCTAKAPLVVKKHEKSSTTALSLVAAEYQDDRNTSNSGDDF